MEPVVDPRIEAVLVFLGWTILRVGIPVLVTAILVLWLKQLDSRWKEQALLEGEAEAQEPACWEVMHCPPARRAHCPAYRHPQVPCWTIFRAPDGSLKPACLDCEVFQRTPIPLNAAHSPAH
jgi:hypothetical protein